MHVKLPCIRQTLSLHSNRIAGDKRTHEEAVSGEATSTQEAVSGEATSTQEAVSGGVTGTAEAVSGEVKNARFLRFVSFSIFICFGQENTHKNHSQ